MQTFERGLLQNANMSARVSVAVCVGRWRSQRRQCAPTHSAPLRPTPCHPIPFHPIPFHSSARSVLGGRWSSQMRRCVPAHPAPFRSIPCHSVPPRPIPLRCAARSAAAARAWSFFSFLRLLLRIDDFIFFFTPSKKKIGPLKCGGPHILPRREITRSIGERYGSGVQNGTGALPTLKSRDSRRNTTRGSA